MANDIRYKVTATELGQQVSDELNSWTVNIYLISDDYDDWSCEVYELVGSETYRSYFTAMEYMLDIAKHDKNDGADFEFSIVNKRTGQTILTTLPKNSILESDIS